MHEYHHLSIDDDELIPQQLGLWLCRSVVLALCLSFFACLAALWFSGILLGGADQLLPSNLLLIVADHRVIALLIPVVCLITCYITLRRLTGEIMAVPELYLDERQKAMRDSAHRTAFKIIKLSSPLIPALLLAQYLPWFHQTSQILRVISNYDLVIPKPIQGNDVFPRMVAPMRIVHVSELQLTPATSSTSTTEVALAGALLLLCLFLLFSALPMSVLAWKGRV